MRQAGEYKHRVVIEAPTETRSTGGSQEFSWATFVSRWARVVPKGAREYLNAQAANVEMDWLWEIKGRAAVTTKMRLVFDSRYFAILGVQSPDGKSPSNADILQLICREGPVRAGV